MALVSTRRHQQDSIPVSTDSISRQEESSNALTQLDVHLSEVEVDPPWDQPSTASLPSQDTIRENMIKHKNDIIDSLNPSQLFKLCYEMKLDRMSTSRKLSRGQKAEVLFDEIIENKACLTFLENLEMDTEHMGHKYIVSLLRGQECPQEEDDSRVLMERVKGKTTVVLQLINVDALQPWLQSNELLTSDESEELQSKHKTPEQKARRFLTLLRTKGPKAYHTFIYGCLAEESTHQDLYLQLTAQPETRKRRPSTDETQDHNTKVTRRYPHYLEPPEGITTQSYLDKISEIRQNHLAGGKMWQVAEDAVQEIVSSQDSPLEMKIAFLLESCNQFVYARQPDRVIARVDQAREMCMKLYSSECNAQVLEGRCEWVLARLYKFLEDFDQAKAHIDAAFSLTAVCELGEEKLLTNFVNGTILLDKKDKSQEDFDQAINSFKCAISLASEEDYGMKMVQYCKIRLAQAYIGTSINDPFKSREEVSQSDINHAKRVLRDMKKEDMHHRTRWAYLLTCSNVYRLNGQMEEAIAYANQVLRIAKEENLFHETSEVKAKFEEFKIKYLVGTEPSYK